MEALVNKSHLRRDINNYGKSLDINSEIENLIDEYCKQKRQILQLKSFDKIDGKNSKRMQNS